jgi:hypothetical protein
VALYLTGAPIEQEWRRLEAEGRHLEPVRGLGDEAFFDQASGIYVAKDGLTIGIYYGEDGQDFVGPEQTHVDLAREVLRAL